MPPRSDDDLSAATVEQIGRLLLPVFRDALRTELHAMRGQFNEALTTHADAVARRIDDIEERIDGHDAGITELRAQGNKVKVVYGVIAAGAGWLLLLAGEVVKKAIGF